MAGDHQRGAPAWSRAYVVVGHQTEYTGHHHRAIVGASHNGDAWHSNSVYGPGNFSETSQCGAGCSTNSSLWIKGIALANTLYSQPFLRPMGDLDVLVPYDQRESTLQVVERLGYHFYETNGQLMSSKEALALNLTHHYHLIGGINDSVVLELHFRLPSADNELLPLDKLAWFWTQTTPLQTSQQFTIPQTEAHLLYLGQRRSTCSFPVCPRASVCRFRRHCQRRNPL